MPVTLRSNSLATSPPSSSPAMPSLPALRRKSHVIDVPDPDFHDFDSSRSGQDIKPGQIWAIYDDKDGMPRYYGRISTVSLSPFKVEFWWLVCEERSSEESKLWTSSSGYYGATGKFENGDFSTTKVINIFSHRMYIKEQFMRGAPTRIIIYPRKGDVWAMYRDWDRVMKGTKTASNVTCEFDLVEILVDYSKENGVKTVKLAKMPHFRAVFCWQDGPQAVQVWSSTTDMLRFSHTVPAVKTKQNKQIGIPKQALELDPAAIPLGCSGTDLKNGPRGTEMRPQPVEKSRDTKGISEHGNGTSPRPSSKRQKKPVTDTVVSTLAVYQGHVESPSPDTDNSLKGLEEVHERPEHQESSIIQTLPATVNSTFQSCSVSEVDFYDFSLLRMETDIEAGQIWAIYDTGDQMPRTYVRVVRVLDSPFKVDLWRLKSHSPSGKTKSRSRDRTVGKSMSCGPFKNHLRHTMGLQFFSHLVLDRANDCVKIYPRKGEVWAMYRNWDFENGGRKVQASDCELVEILSDYLGEGTLQIVRLAKVNGFKSLFQRQGKPIVFEKPIVRPDFLVGFSHSIPSRRMYKDDTLHIPFGAMEVDPACIPHLSSTTP